MATTVEPRNNGWQGTNKYYLFVAANMENEKEGHEGTIILYTL